MNHPGVKISILLLIAALTIPALMCTTAYITPAGLTATAMTTLAETILPTAHFIRPTDTPTPPPTATFTPDPALATPTPFFDTPTPSPTSPPTPTSISADTPPLIYYTQAGDTLGALAIRFGVNPFEIVSPEAIPEEGLINPGQMLMIPQRLVLTTPNYHLLPDSEVVYSPTALDFDSKTFILTVGGYLSTYREYLTVAGWMTGYEIIEMDALNHSVNPRLLLALIEYNSRWVLGQPNSFSEEAYPLGYPDVNYEGLQSQLSWAAKMITIGYYSWRQGTLTEIEFKDGSSIRLAPDLNAGTVGLMYYFAQIMTRENWYQAIDPENGFIAQFNVMFGDPWARAEQVGPLLPGGIEQPDLILPFLYGDVWAFTGGPHGAWTVDGPQAAIDFAPGSVAHGCAPSELWTVAMASGVVTRLENGILTLDLDGDGYEQTGWVIFYLHLLPHPIIQLGTWVDQGDILGKPSCEGGRSTGTHIHIARKFNGEWILADGSIPFVLSGWQVAAGEVLYEGTLTRGDVVIPASQYGAYSSRIQRDEPEEES